MGDIYGLIAGLTFMAILVRIGWFLYTLFALIGFITTIKFFVTRKRKKEETPGERWLRTGKFD